MATGSDEQPLTDSEQLAQHLARIGFGHPRTERHTNLEISAAPARAIVTRPTLTRISTKASRDPKIGQRIDTGTCHHVHTAAMATVTAVGTSQRNIFFAPETGRAVTAITSLNAYFYFINKFHSGT
jgi:hypothetical protein